MNDKKVFITISFILLGVAIFIYAAFFEIHNIVSYDNNEVSKNRGASYIRSIEGGQLLRSDKDNKLYDAKTLVPDAARIDDCPT